MDSRQVGNDRRQSFVFFLEGGGQKATLTPLISIMFWSMSDEKEAPPGVKNGPRINESVK